MTEGLDPVDAQNTNNAAGNGPASPRVIDRDTSCRRCGYNLRGLSTAGQCPECGAEVESSIGSRLLVFADPKWLKSLLRGRDYG